MAVTRTGSVYSYDEDTGQTGGGAIAVPVDADIAVLFAGTWMGSTGWFPASGFADIDSSDFTELETTDDQSDYMQIWLGYLEDPYVDGSETLAWDWGQDPGWTTDACLVFYTGVDATPIGDSDSRSSPGDLTGMTATSGDMMVGGVCTYDVDIDVTDDSQTELFVGYSGGTDVVVGVAQEDGDGDFYHTGGGGETCAALVLAQSAAGPETVEVELADTFVLSENQLRDGVFVR